MTAAARLAWRLLRAGGRRDMLTAVLGVATFAITTMLLLVVLGGNVGFAARAAHKSWHVPVKADSNPVAVEQVGSHSLRDRQVTVVELAALTPDAPVPPGMGRFPAPGELWVSPALKNLLSGVPCQPVRRPFRRAPRRCSRRHRAGLPGRTGGCRRAPARRSPTGRAGRRGPAG
jgi:hypothetical protein